MDNPTELEICEELKKLYDESEEKVKADAMVCRAYVDKLSADSINKKVDAQMNAIQAGIYDINPNFKETSKNYSQIKELVSESMVEYKNALTQLSVFYDGKIEQLILRKVELEAALVGSLLNENYLFNKINRRTFQKENDVVKKSVKESVKNILERIKTGRDKESQIDTNMFFKAIDGQDVINEVEIQNTKSLEYEENSKKENNVSIEKIEKEISLINAEIDRLNDQKKKAIYDAMEVGSRAITKNIKRPKVFKKITRFFVSRFNTSKVIQSTIIDPLNLRIESFKSNELSSMNG